MGELGLDGGVSVGFGCGSPYRQFFVLRAPIVASLLAIVFLNSRYFHPKSPEMVYLKILTAVIAIILGTVTVDSARLKRQSSVSPQNGDVIDSIFNIPITAIKQTSAAAQSFSPENSGTIDSVFKIPITTLEAVGNLIKNRSPQRRQEVQEEQQRRQQEKRDRIIEKREHQKYLKIQRDEMKKKKIQLQKERYFSHKDPLGLNALTNVLVGHHGILGGHGGHGNHGVHQGLGAIYESLGNLVGNGGHGSHGSNGSHGSHGSHSSHGSHGGHGGSHESQGSHTYEVHEYIDEPPFSWPGWPSFGHVFGSQASSSAEKIENKIAPKDNSKKIDTHQPNDEPLENKLTPKEHKKYEKSTSKMERRSSIRFESDPAPAEYRSSSRNFWPTD